MRAESGDAREEDLTRRELGSCPLVSFHYQRENRFKDWPETTQPVDGLQSSSPNSNLPRVLVGPVVQSRHSLGRWGGWSGKAL